MSKAFKQKVRAKKSSKHSKKTASRSKPKKRTPTKKPSTPRTKVFYNVAQDAKILEQLRKVSPQRTKSHISKELALDLGRTTESIRDRIKRYISLLSSADQKLVMSYKKKKDHYIHWEPKSGD